MEKILVVEDEKKLNDVVRDYLISSGYDVVQSYNGSEALKIIEADDFALIILDLMLPGLDGIEVARRVRQTSSIPIIMLTARDSEADKLLGLEIGADDYLTKPFSLRELCARVRAVLRRCGIQQEEPEQGTPLKHRNIEVDRTKRLVLKDGKPVTVTSAQFDLFCILLQSPGRVFTRSELIEKISGYEYEGYERTIDVQIKNLRKVLEDNPATPQLLMTVWGVGYKVQE